MAVLGESTGGPDFLVVGNGALGLFLAQELAGRGAKVTVVGPAGRSGGASAAAGAMLGCFGEATKDTMRTTASRAKFEVSLAAHKRWPAVLAELGQEAAERGDSLRAVPDTFVVLNTCGGELDSLNFTAMLSIMDQAGEPYTEAQAADIQAYTPRADARALRIVHLPHEGAVDGNQVLSLLETKLRRAGVRLLPATVESLLLTGGIVSGAQLDTGEVIRAPVVVVAAGAQSTRVLGTVLGRDDLMPLFPGTGVAMVGRRTRGDGFRSVVRTPNRSGSCGLHLVPFGDGREYLGATNVLFDRPQHEPDVGMGHFLSTCAMQQLDERICFHKMVEWRTGNRPVTLDGFPLIGWTSIPNVYLLTGTFRDGFHCAPVLAEHVAGEMLGDRGVLPLPFAPHRSPIRSWSADESIDEYVLHMLAGWFEARAEQPPDLTSGALGQAFRRQAESVFETLGTDQGFGPEVLIYLTGPEIDRVRLARLGRYLRRRTEQPVGS